MGEFIAKFGDAQDKPARYREAAEAIEATLIGETDPVARMATVVAILKQAFEHYFWAGYYLVDPADPEQLVVGPYQGTPACLRIAIGKGVCGTAAATGQTQIVADVHAFPGHIACDARSESEIVVPVFDREGLLFGVFDVDATIPAAFDEADGQGLRDVLRLTFA